MTTRMRRTVAPVHADALCISCGEQRVADDPEPTRWARRHAEATGHRVALSRELNYVVVRR